MLKISWYMQNNLHFFKGQIYMYALYVSFLASVRQITSILNQYSYLPFLWIVGIYICILVPLL
jgi:hypothetical protein